MIHELTRQSPASELGQHGKVIYPTPESIKTRQHGPHDFFSPNGDEEEPVLDRQLSIDHSVGFVARWVAEKSGLPECNNMLSIFSMIVSNDDL
jgi:hypothetical protein